MGRSIALGHCICNPKDPCPCDLFKQKNVCLCAGERSRGRPRGRRPDHARRERRLRLQDRPGGPQAGPLGPAPHRRPAASSSRPTPATTPASTRSTPRTGPRPVRRRLHAGRRRRRTPSARSPRPTPLSDVYAMGGTAPDRPVDRRLPHRAARPARHEPRCSRAASTSSARPASRCSAATACKDHGDQVRLRRDRRRSIPDADDRQRQRPARRRRSS
ncbi:MAG: hypothetical protein MZW92_03280 [Comamonadaceae bacterium]|nr:hypothetical protein [Comamonadaceae bacterium]